MLGLMIIIPLVNKAQDVIITEGLYWTYMPDYNILAMRNPRIEWLEIAANVWGRGG